METDEDIVFPKTEITAVISLCHLVTGNMTVVVIMVASSRVHQAQQITIITTTIKLQHRTVTQK